MAVLPAGLASAMCSLTGDGKQSAGPEDSNVVIAAEALSLW